MPTHNGPVIRATGGGSTNATTVTITNNNAETEDNVIVFVANAATATGNVGLESDADLNYNPNTGLLTSTGFAGAIDGALGGNTPAVITGTTVDATTDFTVGSTVITDKVVTFTPSTGDTVTMTSATNGAFTLVTVDTDAADANIQITADGNIQITADGTVDIDSAGVLTLDSGAAINIEPEVGSAILLDGTISIDAGVVTGATSITSTAFAGALTGNADTVTTNANLTGHITSTGNAAVLGSFTSAQLSTALTGSATGSGDAVFATSPTLVTPALGTPTALVLTSATGLPAAGVVGTASTLSDVQTLTGTKTLNGTSSTLGTVLLNAAETTTITATVPPSTVNFDAATQSVLVYTTNANATWITNLRFSSGTTLNTALATGQSLSVTLMAAQGATAYLGVVFQIDGVTVTPLWQGGLPTAAGASGTDVYTFTVTKTGSAAYRVIASMSSFN